jgi:hypothetical protein
MFNNGINKFSASYALASDVRGHSVIFVGLYSVYYSLHIFMFHFRYGDYDISFLDLKK